MIWHIIEGVASYSLCHNFNVSVHFYAPFSPLYYLELLAERRKCVMLMNIIIPYAFQGRSLGVSTSSVVRNETHRNITPSPASCRGEMRGKEKETEPLTRKHTLYRVQGHCKVNPRRHPPQQGY